MSTNKNDEEKKEKDKDEKYLNLNLEAIVQMGYQDKLKRDRVGIIFKQAMQKSWEPLQKKYEESTNNTLSHK